MSRIDENAERAAFEEAEWKDWKVAPEKRPEVFERLPRGSYVLHSVEERWQGWRLKALAMLAEPKPCTRCGSRWWPHICNPRGTLS